MDRKLDITIREMETQMTSEDLPKEWAIEYEYGFTKFFKKGTKLTVVEMVGEGTKSNYLGEVVDIVTFLVKSSLQKWYVEVVRSELELDPVGAFQDIKYYVRDTEWIEKS